MELTQLTAGQLAVVLAMIAGITELINRLRAKDFWVAFTILTSAVVGGLLAALQFDASAVSGVLAGFTASGVITTVGSIGNKSAAVESTVVSRTK